MSTPKTKLLVLYAPMTWWQLRFNWDLRTISLGCVSHCQSIGRVERSLKDLPFHTPIAGSFLHVEKVCLLAETSASWSARYSQRIVARDISVYQVVCFHVNKRFLPLWAWSEFTWIDTGTNRNHKTKEFAKKAVETWKETNKWL